ncbi:MAG: GNAT family N-acetyltransferase [Gemmatimonadetes bacterium]|nr:MAG: GNAT family N-acetyltransferase [Gemmatimonadota bacterium]
MTGGVRFREAVLSDLDAIVRLLADDALGAERETPPGAAGGLPEETGAARAYVAAFEAIERDPNHVLLVGESAGSVCAVLQLSFLPHLTYEGGWRAQIEGVRVAREARGRGVGRALIEEAVTRARVRRCHLVQLTTDRRRPEALAFYRALGFEATHHGMKLHLRQGRKGGTDG